MKYFAKKKKQQEIEYSYEKWGNYVYQAKNGKRKNALNVKYRNT